MRINIAEEYKAFNHIRIQVKLMTSSAVLMWYGLLYVAIETAQLSRSEQTNDYIDLPEDWFPCPLTVIQTHTNLSPKSIETARANLKAAGLIDFRNVGKRKTPQYKINYITARQMF